MHSLRYYLLGTAHQLTALSFLVQAQCFEARGTSDVIASCQELYLYSTRSAAHFKRHEHFSTLEYSFVLHCTVASRISKLFALEHIAKMRLSVVLATLLVAIVSAMPDPLPQGYTGPCKPNNCGASGTKCRNGYLCVPWPHTDPALRKGCTCSLG